MLRSQGSVAPGTDHLESLWPRRSPAKEKCAAHLCCCLSTRHPPQPCSAHCHQLHQPRSPLGFLVSRSPEAFAQHLSLQYPRTNL